MPIPSSRSTLPFLLSLLLVASCSSSSSDTPATSAAAGSAGSGGGSGAGGSTASGGAGAGGSATAACATPAPAGDATLGAVAAAEKLLAAFDASQRAAASFAFDDDAQRTRWSNFPTGIFQRKGVKLGDMTADQQALTFALLASVLSDKGYQQVVATVDADEILKASTSGGNLVFGRAEYYVALLGTPSASSPWALQFGGHHLAINATVTCADISLTPSLTGAQPTSFTSNGQTVRPQGAELDKAFELMGSLSTEQQQKALLSTTVMDLQLGPGQDGKVLPNEGLRASELSTAQQTLLLDLVRARVGILNDEDAAPRIAKVQGALADTYFAWAGGVAVGSAAYYRVTSPTLAMEYAPQQMGGNATDHTHAMLRDPTNEYGRAAQ